MRKPRTHSSPSSRDTLRLRSPPTNIRAKSRSWRACQRPRPVSSGGVNSENADVTCVAQVQKRTRMLRVAPHLSARPAGSAQDGILVCHHGLYLPAGFPEEFPKVLGARGAF